MIQIKIDDTIIDIVEKIESDRSSDIVLDFPLGHPVLHNYISLKILKSKAGNKKLIIATSDKIGRKIGKQLGIEYSLVKDSAFIKESSHKLLHHNFTFFEYFKFQIRSYVQEIKNSLDANKKINKLSQYGRKYNEKTGVSLFLGAFVFSIFIFIFIYYFAVSKTFVYITPEITVRKEAYNFVFSESYENNILGNNKYINISNIEKNISLTEIYTSSDIKNNSQDISQGKVQLINQTPEDITLIRNTRLQDENGIVFVLPNTITIPASVKDNFGSISPGSIEIQVRANQKDAAGKFTGARGNIGSGATLTLPGLDTEGQKLIYAESIEDFGGGVDDFQKMVSSYDIEQSQALFKQKLKNEALKSLRTSIQEENIKSNLQIDILSGGKSISYGEAKIQLQAGIEPGSLVDTFTLNGSISIQAYTYNKESIIQKLKTLINEKNLIGVQKIHHIDTSSLRMSEVIYTKDNPYEVKATYEIEALLLHDFLHNENTYVNHLKSKILGMTKEEATKLLINDPKISNVKIETRPFFMNKVSNIQNNIIFDIKK